MKKALAPAILVVVFLCAGCGASRQVSMEANASTAKFVKLIDDGKTTRDQEQRFIKAMSGVNFELDRAIRGTNKAEATRRSAVIEAQTGIDPNAPLKLEKGN